MHAREKSIPLDLRGTAEPGDVQGAERSYFGEEGTCFDRFAVLVLLTSRGGICRLRPWVGKLVRFGVAGLGKA